MGFLHQLRQIWKCGLATVKRPLLVPDNMGCCPTATLQTPTVPIHMTLEKSIAKRASYLIQNTLVCLRTTQDFRRTQHQCQHIGRHG